MLNKLGSLGGVFGQKDLHPLADARELKRILDELPRDNAFRALDEIAGWFESLQATQEFAPDRIYEVARQLEEAAQPHLKRLSRDYLLTPRLTRADEKRLWSINFGFWKLLAGTYERCLAAVGEKNKAAEGLKAVLPALCARLIGAYGAIIKWEQFHYGPTANELWRQMGHALLVAEAAGIAQKSVALGAQARLTSAWQEFQRAVVFQAASLDSLLPLEIELAERLVEHFLPHFWFTSEAERDSVYWVDLAVDQPPLRLARMPQTLQPSQRFFKPGAAHSQILALLNSLEQTGDVPPEINLGGQYYAKTMIPVVRHLAAYLAPIPPQRKHDRHRVKHRMSVLNGLVNAFVAFSGEFGGRPAGLQMESWVVENVSRGGFGVILSNIPGEWLKVGALIAMQPEGGENWLLGMVRRYHRIGDNEARVGIEALARQVTSVELKVRTASSYASVAGTPALLILDGNAPGEVRVVLPLASFDLRESLEYTEDGQRQILTPVALVEQNSDFELARYRLSAIS